VFALPGLEERASAEMDVELGGLCGRRGERVVLAAALERGGAVLAVDRATLAVAWRVELPGRVRRDAVAVQAPARTPLAGSLARHVPVLVAAPDRLIMIDMDAGAIAWQSAPWPALAGAHLMRDDAAGQYVHVPGESAILGRFDGASGELAAAVALPGLATVWPHHMAAGRIWLFGGERWGVLDAGSLAALPAASAVDVGVDTRDSLARSLGLAAARS